MTELTGEYGLFILLIVTGCLQLYNAEDLTDMQKGNCKLDQWECLKSRKCIPMSWKCDVDVDCGDGDDSDEQNCPVQACAEEEFLCSSTNSCVPKRWICDGEPDCQNGEDEKTSLCESVNLCGADEFFCTNDTKSCISIAWRCDGNTDCVNGADEMNCIITCGSELYECNNGQCISKTWVCDGDHDCADMSDEENCEEKTCSAKEFRCEDLSRCIDIRWKCDGDFDCPDHSDETHNCHIEETSTSCLPLTEFACVSGECIHKSWVCDGDNDCTDGSDEDNACVDPCIDDQFTCDNNICIQDILRCDGVIDCVDGSDENNCGTRKTCDELGEFDCYGNGSICISVDKLCDDIYDCYGGEDENAVSCRDHGPCSQHICPNNSQCVNKEYSNKTFEAKCECDKGFRWSEDQGMCKDIDECEQQGACSQICTNTHGGYKCDCFPSYSIEKHHFCRANGERPWLYYANRRDIRKLRTDIKTTTVIHDTKNSVALDIDYEDSLMFWTDLSSLAIMRGKLYGNETIVQDIKTVVSDATGGKFFPEGIAVDWLYKNIYWTDAESDTISVANYAGDKSVTLISTGLQEPRAICVDPENGYMYWTDWGEEPKIERCGMDGQNRETIVNTADDLGWPNGLTIDYVGKRIYWIDSKFHKIGTANMDGSDKAHVLVDPHEIKHPFSITVFEDTLYWTDWHTNSIRSINKFTGKNATVLSIGSYSVMDVKVYHELRQIKDFKEQSRVLCENAQCEYMCLPAARNGSNVGVSCVCADNENFKKSCKTAQTNPTHSPEPTDKPIQKSSPDLTHNTTQEHTTTQRHSTHQKHTTTQRHTTHQKHITTQRHTTPQKHTTTQRHTTHQKHTTTQRHTTHQKHTTTQRQTDHQEVPQPVGTTQQQPIQTTKNSTLGNRCSGNTDCWLTNSFSSCNGTVCGCTEGICTCGESYEQKNDTCVKKSLYTDGDEQCSDNNDLSDLSDKAVIGISIGSLIGLASIVFAVIYFIRCRKRGTDQNVAVKYSTKKPV